MDQAAKLREQSKRAVHGPEPRVIAVTSGKGGVGKTNLVANVGICLAEQGYRVLLLDADIGTANLDVLFGMYPKFSLYEVMRGECSLEEVIVTGPGGIKLIPGAAGFHEMAYLEGVKKVHLEEKLKEFTQQADFLLIDTGGGISKNVLSFISIAPEVIVVVTPEPTSLADAYAMIKLICRFNLNQRLYTVVNMAASVPEANQTAEKIRTVSSRFLERNIGTLGYILNDNCVRQAVRDQVPLVHRFPRSDAAHQVRSIASALASGRSAAEPFREGFVAKLLRIFG